MLPTGILVGSLRSSSARFAHGYSSIIERDKMDVVAEVFGGRRMKVAVIGGSIGGLSAATVLHRLGCEVKVFEKSATPFKGRGGSIGYHGIATCPSGRKSQAAACFAVESKPAELRERMFTATCGTTGTIASLQALFPTTRLSQSWATTLCIQPGRAI